MDVKQRLPHVPVACQMAMITKPMSPEHRARPSLAKRLCLEAVASSTLLWARSGRHGNLCGRTAGANRHVGQLKARGDAAKHPMRIREHFRLLNGQLK